MIKDLLKLEVITQSGKLTQKQNVRLSMGKFVSSFIHIHESCCNT
jgi:hypothetical protein